MTLYGESVMGQSDLTKAEPALEHAVFAPIMIGRILSLVCAWLLLARAAQPRPACAAGTEHHRSLNRSAAAATSEMLVGFEEVRVPNGGEPPLVAGI